MNIDTLYSSFKEYMNEYTINEEHGVNKFYELISEELYNAIISLKPIIIDKGIYEFSLNNYEPKSDIFIKEMSVKCFVGLEGNSVFIPNKNTSNISKDGKLINVEFRFYVEPDKSNQKIPDKDEFYLNLCHEFNHAFRYFRIIGQNNSNLPVGEELIKDRYDRVEKIKNNFKFEDKDKFSSYLKMFLNACHFTNDDEINAYSSEIYEFLKQHQEINKFNIFDNFKSIPSYFILIFLRNCIVLIDKASVNDDIIVKYVAFTICTEVLLFKKANEKNSLMLLRQFFAKKFEQYQRQFFKVVRKALYDLGRYGKNDISEIIKNVYINKQMSEILNKIL